MNFRVRLNHRLDLTMFDTTHIHDTIFCKLIFSVNGFVSKCFDTDSFNSNK